MEYIDCPHCTLRNLPGSTQCNVCQNVLQENKHIQDLSGSPTFSVNRDVPIPFDLDNVKCDSIVSAEQQMPEEGIVCTRCTFVNPTSRTVCEICDEPIRLKKSRVVNKVEDSSPNTTLSHGGTPPSMSESVTAGVIPLIRASLKYEQYNPSSSNILQAYRLSCSATPHITQKGVPMGGEWSCGYRNIQMLCYSLMALPAYRARLFGGAGDVPDVHGLQAWIEKAWRAGFDTEGSFQLGGTLLGTNTWIGATECAALLRFMGVRAHVVDFSSLLHPFQSHATSVANPSSNESTDDNGAWDDQVQAIDGACQSIVSQDSGSHSSRSNVFHSTHRNEVVVVDSDEEQDTHVAVSRSSNGGSDLAKANHEVDFDDNFVDDWQEGHSKSPNKPGSSSSGSSSGVQSEVRKSARKRKKPLTYAGHISRKQANKHGDEDCILYSWVQKYYEDAQQRFGLSKWIQEGESRPSCCVCGECGENAGTERCVFVPPLYFQHQGHSRTLVGYEERTSKTKSSSSLFVFDPNVLGHKLFQKLMEGYGWQVMVKRGNHTLHNDEYQIVYVEPGLMKEGSEEYNSAKILTSDTHMLWTKKEGNT